MCVCCLMCQDIVQNFLSVCAVSISDGMTGVCMTSDSVCVCVCVCVKCVHDVCWCHRRVHDVCGCDGRVHDF